MAIIAERYVQALLKSSKDDKQSVEFQKGLENIANLFVSNDEFRALLLNPCVSNDEKLNTIKEAFPEYCKDIIFTNFLSELLTKKRINLIKSISDEYSKINSSLKSELTIKIIVASKLDDNQINDIVNKYKKLYNANTVNYTVELDESIIGGVKVAVGNTIYDSSLDTQLKAIF